MKYATSCPHTDRPYYAKGLCNSCYTTQRHRALRKPPSRQTPRQTECHPERPHYARGLCTQCYQAKHRRKYRADGRITPEQTERDLAAHRAYHRRHRYGLEPEEYQQMVERQDGRCAICRRDVRLVVDHDHATKAVRGLLCDLCNHAVGYLEGWIAQVGLNTFNAYLS